MPAPLDAKKKSQIVDQLFRVFRDRGYEGSSLADLSHATGLGRSSLYHHFPQGKEEMAEVVLEHGKAFIQSAIADVVQSREPLKGRVNKVVKALNELYAGGRNPCVLAKLAIAEIGSSGHALARDIFDLWTAAIAELARDSGLPPTRARQFAEDWIARLQGSLILHSATGDRKPFERAISALTRLTDKEPTPARSSKAGQTGARTR